MTVVWCLGVGVWLVVLALLCSDPANRRGKAMSTQTYAAGFGPNRRHGTQQTLTTNPVRATFTHVRPPGKYKVSLEPVRFDRPKKQP